jgi:hypothetical protein
MSICELRSEVAQRFGVPPEQQRLAIQGEGDDAGTHLGSSSGRRGDLVGEGSTPSTTVWGSGVRTGMRLLLVATDAPVAAAGDGAWSVERVVGLRRESLRSEVARVQRTAKSIGAVVVLGLVGGLAGSVLGGALLGGASPGWYCHFDRKKR